MSEAAPCDGELSRLAELHGVATSYSPSPDRTVAASAIAVIAALGALGVDASGPEAVRTALADRERDLAERLLPPTVVHWTGAGEIALDLPAGTRLELRTEDGETRDDVRDLPLGVHLLTATAPDGRTARTHLVVAPDRLPTPATRSYGLLVQLYSLLSRRSWAWATSATSPTSPTGPHAPRGPDSCRSTRCTRPCPAPRPTRPRTAPPPAASPTRCICASSPSPSTPPWTPSRNAPNGCGPPSSTRAPSSTGTRCGS